MRLPTFLTTVSGPLLVLSSFGAALPDLVPTGLQAPPAITNSPHPLITISWRVTNQGGSPAAGYYDGLYISTNATFDNTASFLGSWYVAGPIAPGTSYSATNNVQLPIGFSGNYYVLFKTDIYNSVLESNENNNVISSPLRFRTVPPDLAPLSALVPGSLNVLPNPTLTFVWSITNLGPVTAAGGWADAIYLSTNSLWTPDALFLGSFSPPASVPAGQLYWQTNTTHVPVTTSGNYYLIFQTDAGNNLYETNFSNNTLSVPVAFNVQAPDLAALPLRIQDVITSEPDPSVTVIWGVTNQGLGVAQGSWNDSLILSSDNVLGGFNNRTVSTLYENGPVAPGKSYWRTNVVQLPIVRSGTYYLFFQTDVQNSLFESDVTNNITSLPIAVTILQPDLAPVFFQIPTIVTSPPNPTLSLSWGVTNLGQGSTFGFWQDGVYLSTNATFDSNAVALFTDYENGPLDSGEEYRRTYSIQVPVTQSGSYYLIFNTDIGNALGESNTNNNIAARPISFTILPPNLTPIGLQFTNPVTSSPNPTIQVVWGVTNNGIGTADGNWLDTLYFSSDAQLDHTDVPIGGYSERGPIPSGGTYWRTNSVQVPVTQSGTYYLILAANADSNSKIFESNYADNNLAVPITFNINPPDLAPVLSSLPTTITGPPYPTVTLVWGITNRGTGTAATTLSGWNDNLFLSSDPSSNPTGSPVFAAYDFGPILPGGTLWLTNTVRLPVTANATRYWVAQANVNQLLFESDYNNNVAVMPVNVEIRPPDLAPIALQAPSALTGAPYPSVTVVWGVTNQGTGAAIGYAAWSDHIYVSTNASWDSAAADVFSTYEQGPVEPGSDYWRTNTVRLPISSNGAYYLFFKANALADLIESNYSNNTAGARFVFNVQPPDLAPVSVQAPSSVTGPPYPNLTYVWGVTNQGIGTALAYSAGWLDAVALSTNDVWDWSEPQLGWSYQSGPVLPGGVYWQTNTLRAPVTQSGQYHLIFNTDVYLTLVESDYSNNIVSLPVTFTIQPPDLAPMALQVPSTIVTSPPNPNLIVVWGVTNQGIGPAVGFNNWNDQLYLSTSPSWTPQATPIVNSYESGPIAPGQTYWRTNSIHLSLTQSGTYYLIFRVDDSNVLVESDKSNNIVVVPITFDILPPDLAPVPPPPLTITGPPNPTFTLVWGVTNLGPGQAVGFPSWNDQVYFSTNPRLDPQDPVISSLNESGPIDPGGVAWQTNSVWAPVLQSGKYYLIFRANADSFSPLFESNYSNNVAVVPVTFNILPPDLAPIALEVPSHISGPPNPIVTFIWGVTNQGTGIATSPSGQPNWSDTLYMSNNLSLGQGEQYLTSESPSSAVPPGGSYWFTNSFNLPITQSGTYFFTLQVNASGYLVESDYNNDTLTVPVTFDILPPDLAPLAVQVSTVVTSAPNPKLSIVWGVTNQGIGTAQGSWSDQLFISTNSTLDSSAMPLTYAIENGPIPKSSSYWQTNLLQIPVVQSGRYYLIFKVNNGNNLFESDYNNNLLAIPLTFTILPPDLAPIAMEAPSQVAGPPNPTINLAWGVTNQGVGPAIPSGAWVDRIYLSTTPVFDPINSQPLMTQYQRQEVPARGQYWRSQWVQVPVITNGTYYLIFRTDADNAIYESDEDNNDLALPVTFKIQAPDLAPISLQTASSVTSSPYPSLKLTWGVTNQGVGPAETTWQDAVYFSTDPVLDPNDTLLTYQWEPGPLPAGSTYWRTQTIRPPVTNSGKFYLIFRTDAANSLDESNTNNNVVAVPVTFNISAPDLAPIAFQVPSEVTDAPNPSFNLVWGVTNQGPGDILASSAFWVDQVSFSTNASLDAGGVSLITALSEAGPVLAGDVYWRTNTVEVPVTQDGTYYFFLQVNAASYQSAFESDYSNNFAVAKVNIHITPPDLAPIFLQSSVSTPASPYPFITIAWGVTNQGTGPVKSYPPWTVTVSVTKTNPIDGSVESVGSWDLNQTNSIPTGGSYFATNSIPTRIVESGAYSLTFTLNEYGLLHESNTNNNSATNRLPVTIAPADISPIFFSGPATVTGLSYPAVTLVWGVTNSGLAASLPSYYFWDDRVYISTNSFLDNSAIVVGDWSQKDYIPAGGSYWNTNSAQLPVQTSGNYYLILQVDALRAFHETDVSNNVAVIPVKFNLLPPTDLIPLSFQAPTNVITPPNPTLIFVWGVTNQGTGPAKARTGWTDAVYFSPSPTLDGNEVYIGGNYETNTLTPGAAYWRTNTAVVPVNISGHYYLIFKTDADLALVESDYANNTATVPVTFSITPSDLAPIAFYAPPAITGAPNPSVTLVIGVTNLGVGTALAASDALYISATPTRDSSAKLVATWPRTNSITPGGTYWLTNTMRLPIGEGGNYYLIFEADTYNALLESDTLNNVASVPIWLALSLEPDLVLQNLQFNVLTGLPNPTVQFIWNEVNQGLGPAVGPWTDTVVLITNFYFYPGLTVGNFSESATLPVGAGFWRTNNVTLPVVNSGTYNLTFQVNAANDVYELDYGNNVQFVPVTFAFTNLPTVGLTGEKLLPDGSFIVGVSGSSGSAYTLETSTNLLDWVRTTDFVCTNVPTWIVDSEASRFVQRFYRVTPYAGVLATPLHLDIASRAPNNNALDLKLDGPLTADYRIQISTNLINWITVTNFPNLLVSPVSFRDASVSIDSHLFYRAVSP